MTIQRRPKSRLKSASPICRTKQRTLTGALVAVRKPTIAALPGPAAGAGMALALACDIRIASKSAIMSTGYARIGLTGDYGIAWLLTRLVGTSRARELMFLSERIDARRCEALGLVNRVVPDAELREAAFALAKSLAEGPSIALARIKDNLDHAVTSDFLDSMDQEAENMVRSARTTDHKEAVRAFIDKRKPSSWALKALAFCRRTLIAVALYDDNHLISLAASSVRRATLSRQDPARPRWLKNPLP